MQTSKLGTTFILALSILGLADVRGAGTYLKLDYLASIASNELQVAVTYTLWIPEDVKTIRGIIVHQHGAGTTASIEGSTAAYDLHWQALAKKWDCALWGSSYLAIPFLDACLAMRLPDRGSKDQTLKPMD